MYFCLKMETKNSVDFELSNIKKWELQNGSNNILLTTFVPASDRFRRVHNAFWTKRWLGWPRCMANACIPPASTIAGLLLEQTDRTETKCYYKHYARTKLCNTDFSNQYRQLSYTAFKKTITFPKAAHFENIYYHTPFQDILNNTDNGTEFIAKNATTIIPQHVLQWNLDFIFLEFKFSSTIMHVFVSPVKITVRK